MMTLVILQHHYLIILFLDHAGDPYDGLKFRGLQGLPLLLYLKIFFFWVNNLTFS